MIKKGIVMSVGLSSLALTIGATDVYASEMGTVTASVLNVRSGASTSHSVVGKLYRGNTVSILETSNGWHKVQLSNGKIGWVSGQYITKTSNPSPEQSESGYGKVTASALNVRSGASTSHSVVGTLHKNDTVKLLSSSNGWFKVELSNGKTGWVSGQYITKTSEPSTPDPTPNPSPEQNESGYGKVTASALNVRSGASTSHSVVGMLYKNDTVKLLSSSNGWYKVELSNGKTGWVSGQYITKTSSPSTPNPNPGESSSNKQQAIVNLAKQQIGKPYVWGAEGPSSFDCSGLTYYVYKNAAGKTLPRTSVEQSKTGTTVNRNNLQPGDLLFSSTNGSGSVSHVGIYIGNGEMIHAPKPGDVVKRTNINTSYWNGVYLWAKRVI